MNARSLDFVAKACGGELQSGSPATTIRQVCTDSRKVQPGDLFIALAGGKFDAHDYLADVAGKGAAAVLIARNRTAGASALLSTVAVITVEDTRMALGRLAARYRQEFDLPMVAIGGSNGKTTTKELLAAVLRQRFTTLWSEASFNNDVGVPLTLLKLEDSHGAAVLEVGTNHPGELKPLISMIQPRFGVITSIGREHLEFFGDLEGVVEEEGWLAELLPASGTLFLQGDNRWAPLLARRTRARVVQVGFAEGNDWRATNFRVGEDGVSFAVTAPQAGYSGEYKVRLLGRHQVTNALLALAAGMELGVSPEEARRGLAECAPPAMRLQIWETRGVRVLDDAYNANADSMLAALQTLHDLPCAGRRVAVLGDMAELGVHSAAAHREAGRRCAELGLNRLLAAGQWAHETAGAARAAGLSAVQEFIDLTETAVELKQWLKPGDLVLLKASRASGFERIGEALRST